MVTVHGSQDCDAQGAILWHRAFANVARNPGMTNIDVATWEDLAVILRHKFASVLFTITMIQTKYRLFTGARRMLSDSDLAYLKEKIVNPSLQEQKPITFHRFAKVLD